MFHRMTRLAVNTLIITTTLFGLQACGGGDSTTAPINKDPASGTKDKIAPTVTTSNLGTVDYTQAIIIKFSEAIVVTDADVVLHQMQTSGMVTVPTSVTVSGSSLTITPSTATVTTPLLPATDYHLILKNTITDLTKNALIRKELSFTTAAEGTGGNGGNPDGGNTTKTITFIELNDLHANLVPHSEMIRQTGAASGKKVLISERGGLARIATKINEIKASNPNSILMNIGDTYHGGAEALFSNGNAIVAPVEALGIDVAVPGNWDFSFGPLVSNARYGINGYLRSEVTRPTIKYLGANAKYKVPTISATAMRPIFRNILEGEVNKYDTNPAGSDFMQPTLVIVKDNVRIGFIGLTSDILEFMHPMMAFNIDVTQGLKNYKTLVSTYAADLRNPNKGNVDFVVVMSELGIHKDLALADVLPSNLVNIIFSAHTHELMQNYKTSKTGVIVVEPGNDTYLGQMDVSFDANNKVVTDSYKWTIHPIISSLDNSPMYASNIATLVSTARAPYLQVIENDPLTYIDIPQVLPSAASGASGGLGGSNIILPQKLKFPIDKIMGNTTIPLDRKNALESSFNNAYTDMLFEKFKTDITITPGFRFDSAVFPDPANTPNAYWEIESTVALIGKVTTADVYRFMPAPYYLASSDITIENLKNNLELGLETVFATKTFRHKGGWMFGYAGLNIEVDLTKPELVAATPTTKPVFQRIRKITANFSNQNIAVGDVLFDASLTTQFPIAGLVLTATGCGRSFDELNLLCSLPNFGTVTGIVDPNGNGTDFYAASDFLMNNITTLLKNVVSRKGFNDISKTPVWPDTEFVQPLYGIPAIP